VTAGGAVSRRRVALLAGAVLLGLGWFWAHTSEPGYRRAPQDRPAVVAPVHNPWAEVPAGSAVRPPPSGSCTPPPGLRDGGTYTCAFLEIRTPAGSRP
jgi:hypothetical protein